MWFGIATILPTRFGTGCGLRNGGRFHPLERPRPVVRRTRSPRRSTWRPTAECLGLELWTRSLVLKGGKSLDRVRSIEFSQTELRSEGIHRTFDLRDGSGRGRTLRTWRAWDRGRRG